VVYKGKKLRGTGGFIIDSLAIPVQTRTVP